MLSAFTASSLVELQPRDRSRVESLLSYGNRLLVGLNTGTLRVYRISETASEAQTDLDSTTDVTNGTTGGLDAPPQDKTSRNPVELLREQPKFARYKIEQLAFIKEANLLVSLAGSYVSFHDLQSLELQETLAQTKGASTFAVTSNIEKDEGTEVPTIVSRLAVAVKRRLLLWAWVDSELVQDTGDDAASEISKELLLPTGIKSLSWASGRRIVVGLSSSYVLVDIDKMTFSEINGPGSIGGAGKDSSRLGMSYIGMGSGPKPLVTHLGGDELLLAKDINTQFIDTKGHSLRRRQIPWTTSPDSLGYSYPYLLALQDPTKGILEVRNTKTLTLLQSISVPSATIMHIPQPSISLAHAGKGFFVASDRVVWRMIAQTYDSQIDSLVDQGHFDEAIVLLEMLEDPLLTDKAGRLRRVKLCKAKKLFEQRNYRDSLDLFSEISAPPEIVIRLYPKSIAGSLSTFANETPEEGKEDQGSNEGEGHTSELLDSEESPDIKKNPGTSSYAPSVASIFRGRSSEDASEPPITRRKPPIRPVERALVGKDLEVAVRELRSFLADIRRRFLRFFDNNGNPQPAALKGGAVSNDPFAASVTQLLAVSTNEDEECISQKLLDVATVVDTTLFRAYMFTNPALAGSLFRLANCCDPDVVMTSLEESKRYHDLIDFLYGKKLHRNALEMLRKFGEMTPQDVNRAHEETPSESLSTEQTKNSNEESPSETSNALEGETTQINGEASHEEDSATLTPSEQESQLPEETEDTVPEDLIGPKRTVLYLQHLSPDMIDLILEFAKWPICADPGIGMEVFLVDTENSESLPRDKVLKFLLDIDADLAVRYLEHVIGELNDMDPAIHTKLLALYHDKLISLRQGQAYKEKEDCKLEFANSQRKFLMLLEESDQYSPAKMLGELPKDDDDFLEARAILFSKMGQHRQALEIYAFKLEDYAKAEAYCNRIHGTGDLQIKNTSRRNTRSLPTPPPRSIGQTTAVESSIYHTLLSLYLQPPHGHPPKYQPAIRLLDYYGSHLPPDLTLYLIPEGFPMKELEYYFTRRMRTATSILRQNQIAAGLRKVQNFSVQEDLLLGDGLIGGNAGRNRNVTISEGRVCRVCHKRLGGSVISVFPDNTVVHLGCASKRSMT